MEPWIWYGRVKVAWKVLAPATRCSTLLETTPSCDGTLFRDWMKPSGFAGTSRPLRHALQHAHGLDRLEFALGHHGQKAAAHDRHDARHRLDG